MHSWLEIDLGAVKRNAQELALRVAPAALCAVVKSNAYGHGLVPVSRAISACAIPDLRFAVFSAVEGLALRDAGIAEPVLVVGPVADDEVRPAADARLECAVLCEEDARRYVSGTRVHVKVDSGVARFGVRADRAASVIEQCGRAGLQVVGVYSHLANAEDLDETFTLEQLARLQSVAPAGGIMTHIAASAAAIMWPPTRLDMVRCGIALYGRWPSAAVRSAPASRGLTLSPALRWYAPVAQTRDIGAGDPVGYGCEFVPQRPSTIAVLPLGYADGLPRAAADGGLHVTIHGARLPVVGRICMNACMVDVTDAVPAVVRGDVAQIDVDDVARAAGTIDYEILARLPASLERRYP
jgi:alanine racemase